MVVARPVRCAVHQVGERVARVGHLQQHHNTKGGIHNSTTIERVGHLQQRHNTTGGIYNSTTTQRVGHLQQHHNTTGVIYNSTTIERVGHLQQRHNTTGGIYNTATTQRVASTTAPQHNGWHRLVIYNNSAANSFRTLQRDYFSKHANLITCSLFCKLFIGYQSKPD